MRKLKKAKPFLNMEVNALKTKEDDTVAEITRLKTQLVDIRQAYYRAKNPNLKEGAI